MIRKALALTWLSLVAVLTACDELSSEQVSQSRSKPARVTSDDDSDAPRKSRKPKSDDGSAGSDGIKDANLEDAGKTIEEPAMPALPVSALIWDGESISGTPTLNISPME